MAPSEQSPESQKPQRSNSMQALGVIAAASVLGLMATRVKPGPLLFLAGAAAAAWLNKRRILPPSRPLILMPERPPEEKTPDTAPQIDAWLTRQIAREQDAPIITLDLQEQMPMHSPFFDELPAHEQLASSPPQLYDNPFLNLSSSPHTPTFEPETLQKLQALEATESAPSSQASWLLGIEPLPSWDELSAKTTDTEPYAPQFLDQPPGTASYTEQAQEPASIQPVFLPPLFQGGVLPDEFCVSDSEIEIESVTSPPAPEPQASVSPPELPSIVPPIESLFSAPISTPQQFTEIEKPIPRPVFVSTRPIFGKPTPQTPGIVAKTNPAEPPQPKPAFDLAETQPTSHLNAAAPLSIEPMPAPEAGLIFAKPGEASFDHPLDAIRPERVPPPPLRPHAALVDAEIIVRPRGLATTAPPLNEPGAPLPSAPIVVPREQRARKNWRSWWHGE